MVVSRILFTAAVAVFAAGAFANGLDRLSAGAPTLERLVPDPFRAQADRASSSTALDRSDTAAALTSARDAVAADPVDPDATPLLASALMSANRVNDAQRTFRVAARFGWRNAQTQAFWYGVSLQAKEYGVAADRLDALLRVHPRLVDQADLLRPMESDATAAKVFAQRLQMNPPYLEEYLDVSSDTPADVIDRRLAVLSSINSAAYPLGCDAIAPFARVLLDNGRRHDAETLWNANCRTSRISGLIADANFTQVLASNPNPFAWRAVASGDLSINRIGGSGGPQGLQLTNSAPGTRLVLIQTVALPVGVYRFHATAVDQGSPVQGKLYLSWGCDSRPPFPNTSGGDLLGSGQKISVSACDRQQIGIWLKGGGASASLQSISLEKIG
jgi:hypothetical protein